MIRLMIRWGFRGTLLLGVACVALYLGDFAIFSLRGSPQSTVVVNRYLQVPLKGNKQEYDYQGTEPVPCSRSLFPQNGMSACWQLRRNSNQITSL